MENELIIADQIDGIPHPAENEQLVGHEDAVETMLTRYASGRMHHAWLLTGPRGIGKATFALKIAEHIFRYPSGSDAPNQLEQFSVEDPVKGKIAACSHPNLLHMARPYNFKDKKFRTQLTVKEIRQTVPFFGTSRGEDGWRVAIVDAADDMNASASNALLKILEEPPERTVFFILAHSPAKVMVTIRSRCQQLALNSLAESQVLEVLERFGVLSGMGDADKQLLSKLANGSVRQGIILAEGEGLELYKRFENAVQNLKSPDWTEIHALADMVILKGREDNYRLLIEFAHKYIEELATGRKGDVQDISMLARWAQVWEKTRKSASIADSYNLDKKQVILNLFQHMGEAVRV